MSDLIASKDITVNLSKSTSMRLYVPRTALNGGVSPGKLPLYPLVVYYHCGRFTAGSKHDFELDHDINDDYLSYDNDHIFCYFMARDLDAMVAAPSYRVAPEHRLPAAYDDGRDALEFIRNSDDEWIKSHADLSNVFLMGTGSGGNLAYNVGIRAADLAPLRIRGLILNQPFFGGEERCKSELYPVPQGRISIRDAHWERCLPVGANRDHEYSNPTVGDGPNMMEAIGQRGWKVLVSGREGDPLIDRQRNVARLMKEKGVDVVEHFNDGDFHDLDDMIASIRDLINSPAP